MAEQAKSAEHLTVTPAEKPVAHEEHHLVVAPTEVSKAASKADDKPEHTHYEVLVDTWGVDTADRDAPKKGDVIAAADIGPHHKWAVKNGVIKGITAKEAAAKNDPAVVSEEDPHVVQTRLAVEHNRAAEQRQNRANLGLK